MLSWIADKILKLFGWRVVGSLPAVKKYVIIIAPHTSNWDFFIFLLLKLKLEVPVNFIGKHTLFVGPFGWFLRKLGGKPVNRAQATNMVDAIVSAFNENERFVFVLSPEGTRSYKDHWKSGFYHIAQAVDVPIQTCFLDVTSKTLGFGPLVELTGDAAKDMSLIADFYRKKRGINPEQFSNVCFKTKTDNHKTQEG